MAKVRIRKAGPGETPGYYNKTSMFLKKAQGGMQVESGNNQEEMLQQYYAYAYQQLSNEVTPDKVYTELVGAGLPDNTAYQLITTLMDKLVDQGVVNPDYKREKEAADQQQQTQDAQAAEPEAQQATVDQEQEDQSMYEEDQEMADLEEGYTQDRSYMATGGSPMNDIMDQYSSVKDVETENFNLDKLIENTPGVQPGLNFPSLNEYIPEYQGANWIPMEALQTSQLETQRQGGPIKKKQFVKNVMSLLKKQAGGEGEEETEDTSLGKGDPMDTLTEDVKKHKNNFLSAIKDKATAVKTEEMYDKLLESEDPELQQLGMQDGNAFQVGGMTGGEDPLFRFIGGGSEAAYGYSTGNLRRAQTGDAGVNVSNLKVNPATGNPWTNAEWAAQERLINEATQGMSRRQREAWIQQQLLLAQQQAATQGQTPGSDIPRAKINYVPNYVTGPGSWGRTLMPWNPLTKKARFVTPYGTPYYHGTNIPYTDPLEGLQPVARQVTKAGLFGRPKMWTDIYSPNGGGNFNTGQDILADNGQLIFPGQKVPGIYTPSSLPGKKEVKAEERMTRTDRGERPLANVLMKSGIPGLKQLGARMYPWETEATDWTNTGTSTKQTKSRGEDVPTKGIRAFINDQLNLELNRKPYEGPAPQFGENAPYNPDMINMQEPNSFPEYYEFGEGMPNRSMAYGGYIPRAQGGLTINNPNNPQPGPANPDIALGNQAGLLGSVSQGPNTVWGAQQSFAQPSPTSPEVTAYNSNPANNMTVEPQGSDQSNCTPEQKRDTTSQCYCSPEQMKDPNNKRCYEGSGLVGMNYTTGTTRTTDPEAMVNVFNAGVRGVTGLLNRRQERANERKMYDNLTSDNLYAAQSTKHRGDWVDFGSMAGQYRFDQEGQDRSGFSSYGKFGGYMQSGGQSDFPEANQNYTEGDEVYMTEEDIRNFMANGGQIEYI